MDPPSTVWGGGLHGKVCWLIAYNGFCFITANVYTLNRSIGILNECITCCLLSLNNCLVGQQYSELCFISVNVYNIVNSSIDVLRECTRYTTCCLIR